MRVFFYNFLFLGIFLAAGIAVTEIFLRYDGRYDDLVNENLVRTRAIWDRPRNVTQYRKHPDLDFEVEIRFNDFRIRNHQGITLHDVENYQGKLIGVFGDSMTENRRIDDKFTFTSLLNEALQPDPMVLNFGIDGYGLDQSYLKYVDFSEHAKFTHVFYIFVNNDLRNIYENQLFDYSEDKVGLPIPPEINPIINVMRKLHVSYLAIDSYARLRAKAANETYVVEQLNEKLAEKFSSEEMHDARESRFHDEYADFIAKDYLSEQPTAETMEWARRFRLLLSAWNNDVISNNGTLTIFVIPTQVATDLASKLFGTEFSANTVYLRDYFPEDYNSFRFKNDNHWAENGNLRAMQAIAEWGKNAGHWSISTEKLTTITEKVEGEIRLQYGH